MSTTARSSSASAPPGPPASSPSSNSASTRSQPAPSSSAAAAPQSSTSSGPESTSSPPTSSRISLSGSPTILGPLTTAWSAPPACNIWQQFNFGEVVGGWNGKGCNDTGDQIDTSTCWPSATVSAPPGSLTNWGFYSPGYSCPVGYATACQSVNGPDGSPAPAPPGSTYYPFQFPIGAGETAMGCCPSGYNCAETAGVQKCFSFGVRSTFSFTEASCAGATLNTSMQTVPFTTRYVFVPTSTTVTSYQFVAPLFQLVHKAGDLPASVNSTSSSSTAASAGSNGGGGGSRLSTGGIVAIAVVIPIVALAAIIGLILFLLRRRKQKRKALDSSAAGGEKTQLRGSPETATNGDSDMTRDPGYGIGYGKHAPTPDTDTATVSAAGDYYSGDSKKAPSELESRRRSRGSQSRSSLGRFGSLRSMFSDKMTYNPSENNAPSAVAELEADHAHEMDAGPVIPVVKPASTPRVDIPSTVEERGSTAAVHNVTDPEPDPQELEAAKRISQAAGQAPEYAGPVTAGGMTRNTPGQRETFGTFLSDDSASKPVTPMAESELPPLPTSDNREGEATASQIRLSKATKVSQVDVPRSLKNRDSDPKST